MTFSYSCLYNCIGLWRLTTLPTNHAQSMFNQLLLEVLQKKLFFDKHDRRTLLAFKPHFLFFLNLILCWAFLFSFFFGSTTFSFSSCFRNFFIILAFARYALLCFISSCLFKSSSSSFATLCLSKVYFCEVKHFPGGFNLMGFLGFLLEDLGNEGIFKMLERSSCRWTMFL